MKWLFITLLCLCNTVLSGQAFGIGFGGTPSGVISMWSGSIGSIPSGWLLCDGTSGTPDLTNSFVIGAGGTYAVDSIGGSADAVVVTHGHDITDPGHVHSVQKSPNAGSTYFSQSGAAASTQNSLSATTGITIDSEGVSGTNANLPPYYAIAYIMKE